MKNILKQQNAIAKFSAVLIALTCLYGCVQEQLDLKTTSDVNMTGYFEQYPEQFSQFMRVLELTGNDGFLAAYGAYTIFAPTNDAFAALLQEQGKTSVENLDLEELKRIVRFHLIEDTLTTSSFTDGKLPRITMAGQYLITGVENVDGVSQININRQGNVTDGNIRVGNGIIHVIDGVLQPATKTLAELIEENPDYSIFTEALKETGFYDILNKNYLDDAGTEKAWFTLLAQTDAVYNEEGIATFQDLKEKYSHTGDPNDPADSLYLYMAYHIVPDIKYLADIATSASQETLAPLEVITSKLKGDTLLINEETFNGIFEKGAPIDRRLSDFSTTNGVLHTVLKDFNIKTRVPTRVYFDLADQPELRVTPNWRNPGSPQIVLRTDQLKDVKLEGGSDNGDFNYNVVLPSEGNSRAFYDYLEIYLRPAVVKSIEFTTPVLVKGKYKVWICYRRKGTTIQAFFNDEPLPRTINLEDYWPTGVPEGELLAQGWKRYTGEPTSNSQARLAGTIEVKTTDRHKIKLLALTETRGRVTTDLDMIQFIPADENQLWPKVAMDGTLLYE